MPLVAQLHELALSLLPGAALSGLLEMLSPGLSPKTSHRIKQLSTFRLWLFFKLRGARWWLWSRAQGSQTHGKHRNLIRYKPSLKSRWKSSGWCGKSNEETDLWGVGRQMEADGSQEERSLWNFSEIYTQKYMHRTRSKLSGLSWTFHAFFSAFQGLKHKLPSEDAKWSNLITQPPPPPTIQATIVYLALKQNWIIASDVSDKLDPYLNATLRGKGQRQAQAGSLEGSDLPKLMIWDLACPENVLISAYHSGSRWLQKRMEVLIRSTLHLFLLTCKCSASHVSWMLGCLLLCGFSFFPDYTSNRYLQYRQLAKYTKNMRKT